MRVSTTYFSNQQLKRYWVIAVAALCLVTSSAWGMTDVYQLSRTTGTATNMSGSTLLFGSYRANVSSSLTNIGFDFYFDGTKYTTFSATTSGLLSLGRRPYATYYPYYFPNSTTMNNSYPAIAGFWGRYCYTTSTGKLHYKLTGTAPNRVLTVEWLNVGRYGSLSYTGGTWQVRLYEGTNRIEFYYQNLLRGPNTSTSYSGAIGIAQSRTRYLNVYGNDFPREVYQYPSGGYYTYYRTYYDPINNNTVYIFNPCEKELSLVGNTKEGGTEDMDNGDVLLTNLETQRGNSNVFNPFSLENPSNGCAPVSYSMTISGAAAGDYSVPSSGTLAIGQSVVPDIRFTPQAVGERTATLTISMSNGQRVTYLLNATGLTRTNWIGNIAQGGTGDMEDGDALMTSMEVNRGESADFMPFTIENFNANPAAPLSVVQYILDDPLNEYEIRLPSGDESLTESLGPNQRSTPIITFAPHANGTEFGTGPQEATLTVIADGETRVFTLNGFSVAPAAEFYFADGKRVITSDHTVFRAIESCVGDQSTVVQLDIENINRVDVRIDQFNVFGIDSRIQQGNQRYPMDLDTWGQLVPMQDYFISEAPGVVPFTSNTPVQLPLVIKPGERRVLYLNFIATRPGKRYARIFMETNAVNFFGNDAENFLPKSEGTPEVEGLMTLEAFARGFGSSLAKDAEGNLNGLSLTFDPVKVGSSVESEAVLYNTGDCELRINQGDFRPVTGDVSDFELIEVFNGATVDAEGNYVIPVGSSATVKARFTPNRSGSRRASVMVRTNDSTISTAGVTERGIYYLNLYGVGKADLRTRNLFLDPAVIDGPGSTGAVRVVNTSTEVIEINNLALVGPNVDEIMQDPANPWPAMPYKLLPEESIDLSVVFNPLSGSASGLRMASVEITYGNSEMIVAEIRGEAGVRSLVVAPPSLFEGVSVPVGGLDRQIGIITNNGTFPVQLTNIRIEGDGAEHYSMFTSGRMNLDPGASEFIEVTYAPTAPGESSAVLVVSSNATNGDQMITLGAMATGISPVNDPSGSSISILPNNAASRAAHAGGLALGQSQPNPARDVAEIAYTLAADGVVELGVYDSKGVLVQTVVNGERVAGTYTETVNVQDLTSGTYVYMLRQNGKVLTRSMIVVK